MIGRQPPLPTPEAGQAALRALLVHRSLLPALQALHQEMGDIFSLSVPGFRPVVLAGPEANHFMLVNARHLLLWRNEHDPVTRLLHHGLLVQDGPGHDELRRLISPALHKRLLPGYTESMLQATDDVTAKWETGRTLNMLEEMRKIALLILVETMFGVDFRPDLERLWTAVLRVLAYISPGLWLLWNKAPRLGYGWAIRQVDDYLFKLIADRRAHPRDGEDMLSRLTATTSIPDDLIRDQMLTMLIAGHDTSTALLAWTLYLLGKHPQAMQKARCEVHQILGDIPLQNEQADEFQYLERLIKETLRMYPPIHVGNRVAAVDLEFGGYRIKAGQRLMYSIYATHRDPRYWPDPDRFDPERFAPGVKHLPYTYLPFGGGPRNCIGAAFAQLEAKVVMARILQKFDLSLVRDGVRQYMGATLEPRPGVFMQVRPRG